jgi:hypothetical protein
MVNTVLSFSTHGQQSAAKGSLTTVSRSDIRLIQYVDFSALGLVRRWLSIGCFPIHLLPSDASLLTDDRYERRLRAEAAVLFASQRSLSLDPSPDTFTRITEQRYQQRNMVPATTQPREPLMA